MDYDDLVERLRSRPFTYDRDGMELADQDVEHDAADAIVALQADLAAVRAESDLAHWLLRNARKYMNPMHEALCAAIDNALQKKQAALAGEKK